MSSRRPCGASAVHCHWNHYLQLKRSRRRLRCRYPEKMEQTWLQTKLFEELLTASSFPRCLCPLPQLLMVQVQAPSHHLLYKGGPVVHCGQRHRYQVKPMNALPWIQL